jgi:hypothetical protein
MHYHQWYRNFALVFLSPPTTPVVLCQYKPIAPVHRQHQSPWWISPILMLPFFYHPLPLLFLLACSMTPLSVTPLLQTEEQKEGKDPPSLLFSFPSDSAWIYHLQPPWSSQLSLPITRLLPPEKSTQFCFPSYPIDNFFQAQSSIPFPFPSACFLLTWQERDCHSCPYYQWIAQDTHHPSQWLTTQYHGCYLPMPVSIPRPTSRGKLHQRQYQIFS